MPCQDPSGSSPEDKAKSNSSPPVEAAKGGNTLAPLIKPPSESTSLQGLSLAEKREKEAARNLQLFIASFRTSGATPPCRSFRSLITIGEFGPYIAKLSQANSEADLKSVVEEFKPFKAALNDLVAMSRNAVNALKAASRQASGKQIDKRAGSKAKESSMVPSSTNKMALFERGMEKGESIPTKNLKNSEQANPIDALASPLVVKGFDDDLVATLTAIGVTFQPRFAGSKFSGPHSLSFPGYAEPLVLVTWILLRLHWPWTSVFELLCARGISI